MFKSKITATRVFVEIMKTCVLTWFLFVISGLTSSTPTTTLTPGQQAPPIAPPNRCVITLQDETFAKFLDDPKVVLTEFNFQLFNYSNDPLKTDQTYNYKPWRWHRTRTQHGRTLLMLSFHYDVLSMSILTIGVEHHNVVLIDRPFGCFYNLTASGRIQLIRDLILDNFRLEEKSGTKIQFETRTERTVYVCNEVVKDNDGYAEFINRCCNQNPDNSITCSDEVQQGWILLLHMCITLVKVMVFFFAPLIMPAQMYNASYVAAEYAVKLSKELKLKMFVTESTQTSVRYKKRLTLEDIADWRRFREKLEECPMDEIVPISVPELRVTVKGKRIIPDNDPPTGIFRTLYDNLIRCKIKRLDPFTECCDLSVYASLEPMIKAKCTWHMCVQTLVKVLLLLLIPLPFYVRVIIYYFFEEDEVMFRKRVIDNLGLKKEFDFYKGNVIQYFSPTHGVFIATYVFYFLSGVILGFSDESVREKLKAIARDALQDMANVSRTSVLQVLLRIGLWPFKKCGLIAIIVAPLYSFIAFPVCAVIFVLYCIPTLYLSYRLIFHARKKFDDDTCNYESEPEKPLSKKKEKLKKVQKKLSKIDKSMHNRLAHMNETNNNAAAWGQGKFNAVRRFLIKWIVGLFCLAVLYAIILIIVEAVGLIVEVMAFTMMGIIINAGSTLRYVSMALLVIVYMHDCYNNVYESYLTFDKSVVEDIMDRVEDLKTVASLPSNMQENVAFQVKPVEAVDEIPTTLTFEKKDPSWKIGHLLLFLDSCDTPRIPLRLFQKVCEIRVHGAPGPVYINLLSATGKFLIIVVFLFFVMIVVMAFGNVHQVSSTNQTLATLAGGFVPMLLKNVLPRKSVKLNLKTLSFKGQIDEIICDFKQNWPIYDFVFKREDEVESEPEEEDDIGGKERKQSLGNVVDDPEGEKANPADDKGKVNDKLEKYMKEGREKKLYTEKRQKGLNGIIKENTENNLSVEEASRRLSVVDDNFVDLFIDLSVADTSIPWQIYGSAESLQSASMLPPDYEMEVKAPPSIPEIRVDAYP